MLSEAHIFVRGMVQGVGFRMHTQREARLVGLCGYVRNVANGDVEVVAQGEADAIERLIAWARRGPPAARVDEVAVDFRQPIEAVRGFEIR